MSQLLGYYNAIETALTPYWAELIGAFLMAAMINLINIKGSQRDSFNLISFGFYTLIARDLFQAFQNMAQSLAPSLLVPPSYGQHIFGALTALVAATFLTGAFKNLKFYFSPIAMVVILGAGLFGLTLLPNTTREVITFKLYQPLIYVAFPMLVLSLSFYFNSTTRRNRTLRSVGNGFIILTICYSYQFFDVLENIQQIVILGYMMAIVLSLAAQIQFLNLYSAQLEKKLESEERSKREVWEISPFPIVISRLRDDTILYMNPGAMQILGVDKAEVFSYPLSSYFVDSQKKNDLLEQVRQFQIVKSFEVQVQHPQKGNPFWIDMTTRTTDWNEEIVLFTTFKDVTEQKKIARILKEQASTDPLTGLYNRRQFEILANQSLQIARRYDTPFTIGMVDIDFFKKVNDTYGHEAGDRVLQNLANTMKDTLRKSDVVARYGGEEFVIFFAQSNQDEARIAAEHVREAAACMSTVIDGKVIPITISIGISDCKPIGLEALIKQADDSLYASKKNGRNRVTLFSEIATPKTEETKLKAVSEDQPNKAKTNEPTDAN